MSTPTKFVPPSAKAALFAPMEAPPGHPASTDLYFPEGVLIHPYQLLQMDLINLALFHRAAYATVYQRDQQLDALAATVPKEPPAGLDAEDLEMFYLSQSRQRTNIHAGESENVAIAGYADELSIIGLWALAEKYLRLSLETLTPGLSEYRWDALLAGYAAGGIDLKVLPGFNGANECRLVNNEVKHSGNVTSKLSGLAAFTGKQGKPIRRVDLDVQRYMRCVHNLIGAVMEEVDHKLAGTTQDPRRFYRTDPDGNRVPDK